MSKVADHLHRYRKINLSQSDKEYLVYKCIKPACSHYLPIKLSEGKICECDRCNEPMVITKIVLTASGGRPMARPHCPNCTKRKDEKDVAAIAAFISGTKA